MKKFRRVASAMLLAAISMSPLQAQQATGFDRVKFVDAVDKEDGGAVRELFDKYGKTILNAKDQRGDTPLTVSIRKRHDWAYFFLREGADPDLPGADGETPLIAASRIGFVGIAEQLLARKVDVDGKNRRGETALIAAVQARQAPMVKLLLENGADPDKTDNFGGRSARDYARQNARDREILKLIETAAKKPAKPVQSADDFKL